MNAADFIIPVSLLCSALLGCSTSCLPKGHAWAVQIRSANCLYVAYHPPHVVLEYVDLLGIQLPEPGTEAYSEALAALSGMVIDTTLKLQYEKEGVGLLERDPTSCHLCAYVFADGKNVNVEMVRLGWARFCHAQGTKRYADDFLQAEREAMANSRGIWRRNNGQEKLPR